MVEFLTGARLLRRLVDLEHKLAAVEGTEFEYTSPGSFNGVAGSERAYAMDTRLSVLEGKPASGPPEGWNQGRVRQAYLDSIEQRIDALGDNGTEPPTEPIYPMTIFEQVLGESPETSNNWTARNVVQITGGAGPQGQVRVTFQATAERPFRINNVSIGISAMADVNDTPDNGATRGVPILLPADEYVPAGGEVVSGWASLAGFTKSNLLVVVIDHNTDTGNPKAATNLGAFPAAGAARQGFALNDKTYNSALGTPAGIDGVVYAVSRIEVR